MCGRFYVHGDKLGDQIRQHLKFDFPVQTNLDLRPTDQVATLVSINGRLQQLQTVWGIKPAWSKQVLINARAETASQKKTFAAALAHNPCLVPCSGWYEWRDEGQPHKQKYAFRQSQDQPLYMAGIYYPNIETDADLVTLTIGANDKCGHYHDRMPLLVKPEHILDWLRAPVDELHRLMHPVENDYIQVDKS